jgi:hypothetical protein
LRSKFKEENEIVASFDSLMEDDSVVIGELVVVTSNIRIEIFGVLKFFLSFLSLQIVSSFVEREQVVVIV